MKKTSNVSRRNCGAARSVGATNVASGGNVLKLRVNARTRARNDVEVKVGEPASTPSAVCNYSTSATSEAFSVDGRAPMSRRGRQVGHRRGHISGFYFCPVVIRFRPRILDAERPQAREQLVVKGGNREVGVRISEVQCVQPRQGRGDGRGWDVTQTHAAQRVQLRQAEPRGGRAVKLELKS
jgi:hypothetical protein